MRIAAIDLGSNSFHMLIANILGQSFETLLRERMTIQIGKTALLSGRLDPEAMERSIQCMQEFRRLAMARRVEQTFAAATSAIREAENGEDFIRRIGKATGIAVRVFQGAKRPGSYIWRLGKTSIFARKGFAGRYWRRQCRIDRHRFFQDIFQHEPEAGISEAS